MSEAVDHPQHYCGADNLYEVIKIIRALGLGFSLGNALKYVARAGRKDANKTVEDLRKAAWYIDEEIAHLERKQAEGKAPREEGSRRRPPARARV